MPPPRPPRAGGAPEGGLDGLEDLAASMDEAAADMPPPDDMPADPGPEPMPGGEGETPPPEEVDDSGDFA